MIATSQTESFEKAVEDCNRRAEKNGYRTWTVEEVLQQIAAKKAVLCEYCGMLILAGNHSSYRYNFDRHFEWNVNCLRVRANLNSAVKSSPAKENDQSPA